MCKDYFSWFSLTEPVAFDKKEIETCQRWYWNISCLCVLSISHILFGSLSHHMSPKGRILEESLIIFTAHSVIPAKRLIHDVPLWRPNPLRGGQKQKNKECSPRCKNISPWWKLSIFWILIWNKFFFSQTRRIQLVMTFSKSRIYTFH